MKSKAWRKDRNWLRKLLREGEFNGTPKSTILCVLVSHMRGKIHMQTDMLKSGGWWGWREKVPPIDVPEERKEKLRKTYGSDNLARLFYARAVIANLADQEAWIRHGVEYYEDGMREVAERILDADNAYAVEEVAVPQEVSAAQPA